MRPVREWAGVRRVKLLGSCAGPAHLSDEPLQVVAPLDLRCRSRGEAVKDELEEGDDGTDGPPPTAKPKQNVKCPVNCDCDVSLFDICEQNVCTQSTKTIIQILRIL